MNTKNLIILLIFISIQNIFGRVAIDKINIDTEFYGALNKTRVEFFLKNTSRRDSLSKTINLKLNKSAIVTNLWLEIDGELKEAETLSSRTGQRIYNRITRRRIDPALMLKHSNGNYSLRVFPINTNQTRRVVIEYYSILESNFSENPVWYFESKKSNMNMNISGMLPPETAVHVQNQMVDISTEKKLIKFHNTKQIVVDFAFSTKNGIKIYGDSTEFYQINKHTPFKTFIAYNDVYIPTHLDSIVNLINNSYSVKIQNVNSDSFFKSFINFLIKKNYLEVMYHYDSWNWDLINSQWQYTDNNFILSPVSADNEIKYTFDIYCPFVKTFLDYNSILDEKIKVQKSHGYLMHGLSKLVLENDERALSIREEELEKEIEIEDNYSIIEDTPQIRPFERQPIFSVIDVAPKIVGGYLAICENLLYPDFLQEQKVEGLVIVKCLISRKGEIMSTRLHQPLHPILDIAAIRAIKQVKWTPAYQRDQPVAFWLSVPIAFKLKSDWKYEKMHAPYNQKYNFQFIDRNYEVSFENEKIHLFETGFKENKNPTYEYLSDEFFQLLIEDSSLIEYVYELFHKSNIYELGIISNGRSILIRNLTE